MTLFLFRLDLCFAGIILKSCKIRACSVRLFTASQTPPPLENAYIIYSLLGALIYIVQLETCKRCESHPKGKKSHVHACRVFSTISYSLVVVFEDITNVSQSVGAPPSRTSNIANPHHTACQRQLILSSLLSFYCSTN